jgi:hypothetical protein
MPFPREDKLKYFLSIGVTFNDENFHIYSWCGSAFGTEEKAKIKSE